MNRGIVTGLVVLLGVLLSACGVAGTGGEADEGPPMPLEGSQWQLETIVNGDERIALDRWGGITLGFEMGAFGGRTACNSYGGEFEAKGATISFPDGIFRTAAACGDPFDTQERLYFELLETTTGYDAERGKLVLSGPRGSLEFTARETVSSEAALAIEAQLREWASPHDGPIVILAQSKGTSDEIPLDALLDQGRTQFERMAGEAGVDSLDELFEGYRALATTELRHADEIELTAPVIWLDEDEATALLGDLDSPDWAAFESRYPESRALYTFSRVAIDEAGEFALLRMGLRSPSDSGEFLSLLTRGDADWHVSSSFRVEAP